MRVALIASPFIPVPPVRYGGTELFVANLARWLHDRGYDVVVYANGESSLPCEVRSLYRHADWPLTDPSAAMYKTLTHLAWALADCRDRPVDVVHLNDSLAACLSVLIAAPKVLTLHHPHEATLTSLYEAHPEIHYVAISGAQADSEPELASTVIHHGIDLERYTFRDRKDDHLCFIGRITPEKGAHIAVDVARRAGRPLKMAGEIQPIYRDYWNTQVRPWIDGRDIEYVGEADHALKTELLGRSSALLFPIRWQEPFGLAMIEAMACGTPVLALPGGSVAEIVENGVNGWICEDTDELTARAIAPNVPPRSCRASVEARFDLARMGRAYEALYRRVIEHPRDADAGGAHVAIQGP